MRNYRPSLLVVLSAVVILSGCNKEPFSYVRVSGKLCYEDGSPIPGAGITLMFLSQTPPKDPKTYPRPGVVEVNKDTGEFDCVTTHKYGDGLIIGKHKVVVTNNSGAPLPASVVPTEYSDYAKTPLLVDTADEPFNLQIKKPRR
jgi:hypothetical protein